MGKLSKCLLGSILLFGSVRGNTNVAVTGCNVNPDNTGAPAMTFQVAESYFRDVLNEQESDYTLANGLYTRTVPESELTLQFGQNAQGRDVIKLVHTLNMNGGGFDLDPNAGSRISFGSTSQTLECHYERSVDVDDSFDVAAPPSTDTPIINTGNLSYDMTVDVGGYVGGTTTITITPNHSLDQIAAVLTQCRVSYDDASGTNHEVFPVHSFNNDPVCFDNTRLDVVQTQFTPDVAVTMRTFRFNVPGADSTAVQQQTIACTLHLDPVANLVQDQAVNCDCYTESQCICNSCDSNASCDTTNGVTSCSCNAGYSGDGTDCTADAVSNPTDPASYNLPSEYDHNDSCGTSIFYRIHTGFHNYADAIALCENDHPDATLPIPLSDCENTFIGDLRSRTVTISTTDLQFLSFIWLGIDDIATNDQWLTTDGSTPTYFNWDLPRYPGTSPAGSQDAAYFGGAANNVWRYIDVGRGSNVLCTYRSSVSNPTVSNPSVSNPTDPASYNLPSEYDHIDSCGSSIFYRVHHAEASYADAIALCENDHPDATLPIPLSDCENTFIADLQTRDVSISSSSSLPAGSTVLSMVWLGINDIATNDQWVTTDGSTPTYTNWQLPRYPGTSDAGSQDGVMVLRAMSGLWRYIDVGPNGYTGGVICTYRP